jgi:NAD(P)-dependent dehydrogenase (short-subunit alcohol dehydrogenase family)
MSTIAIIGASGAIGSALTSLYAQDPATQQVLAFSRKPTLSADSKIITALLDLEQPDSITTAARLAAEYGTLNRVIVCSGFLHDAGMRPEKTLREIRPDKLQQNFAINTIGPALVMQQFLPLLQRSGRPVFAALSARVGSISDNQLGGWYSYRASKAALNMLIACAAIELHRTNPAAIILGLHPGTVDSKLSSPFQARLAAGQLKTAAEAAQQLRHVIDHADGSCSGSCLAWDGKRIAP